MGLFAGYSESKDIKQVNTTLSAEDQFRGDLRKEGEEAAQREREERKAAIERAKKAETRARALQLERNPEDPSTTKYGRLNTE